MLTDDFGIDLGDWRGDVPEPMDFPFSAAAQMAGYQFQLQHALLLLVSKGAPESVRVEMEDDIVSVQLGGRLSCSQYKHSGSPGRLTVGSSEVWKTLRVWMKAEEAAPPPTAYELITTDSPPLDGLVHLLASPRTEADIGRALEALDHAAAGSASGSLERIHEKWLLLDADDKRALLRKVTISCEQGTLSTIPGRIRTELARTTRPERLDRVLSDLLGWFTLIVDERLRAGGFELTQEEMVGAVHDFHAHIGSVTLLHRFEDGTHPTIEQERREDPMYIQQLDLLEAEDEHIQDAIACFHRGRAERQAWLSSRVLGQSMLDDYDARLRAHWNNIRLRNTQGMTADAVDRRDRGWRIYWETTMHYGRIGDQDAAAWVAKGTYHQEANRKRIGWHPDFAIRLPLRRTE